MSAREEAWLLGCMARRALPYLERAARDEKIPHTVEAATRERDPARWIREFLLRQGKGVVHVAPGVSGLIEIALKFHEPVMA